MFTYSKEIRSFILGIIAWEILSMLLKCGYSESFSQTPTPTLDISGWADNVDSVSDISGAAAIFEQIDGSTQLVIKNIQTALENYEKQATSGYGEVGSEYKSYYDKTTSELTTQKNLLSQLGTVLKNAALGVKDNQQLLNELLREVYGMTTDGTSQIGSLKKQIDDI